MASMVTELLDASTPVLVEIIEMTLKLQNKPEKMHDHLMEFVDFAKSTVAGHEQELEGLFPKPKRGKPKGKVR